MRKTILLSVLLGLSWTAEAEPVLRQPMTEVYALTGVRIVTEPGEVIESGTIVVRDGIIEAVGAGIDIPPDAAIYAFDPQDNKLTVYPGLIDAYVPVSFGEEEDNDDNGDSGEETVHRPGQYPHPLITPGRRLSSGKWPGERIEALRKAGFTTALIAPDAGVVRGHSAVVNLGEGGYGANVIDPERFQHVSLQTRHTGRQFPNSLMGAMALLRQTFMDAQWQAEARRVWRNNPGQPRPEFLEDLDVLEGLFNGSRGLVIEVSDMLDSLRAAALAAEFELQPRLVGHGEEYKRLESLSRTGLGQILPLDFPPAPDIDDEDKKRDVSLAELRHWHHAPDNPARVFASGLPVLLTSHPHSNPGNLFENLEKAIERGLDADQALAALTTDAAEWLGIGDRAGRLRAGHMANFIVVEGELFTESPSIREVWVDGIRHLLRVLDPPEVEPAGEWALELLIAGMGSIDAVLTLRGEAPVLAGSLEIMGSSVPLSEARVSGSRLDIRVDGARLGMPGAITLYMDIDDDRGRGAGSSPQGDLNVRGRRTAGPDGEEEA